MRLLLLLACVACAAQTNPSNEVFGRLRGLHGQSSVPKNTDERVALFEGKLKDQPHSLQLLSGLASAFMQKVRETTDFAYLDRASSVVDRMLTEDPQNYDALRLRIEIAMQKHQFPVVVDKAQALIERNQSDSGVYGLLGDALMELGKCQEAEVAYKRMLELAPGLPSYNRMAYQRFVTGNPDEALAWMGQAVEAGSPSGENQAWALVEFGDLLFKSGRMKEAEAAYRRAQVAFPGYHRAAGALGRLLAAKGEVDAAVVSYRLAQSAVPLPEYAAALARLAVNKGNTAEAKRQTELVDAVEKLMRAYGEKANRTLALIYADDNRNLARSLEIAQGEFEVRDDVYSYDALSWALYKNGKISEAREASLRALAPKTPEPLFYFHAGMIALASGAREEARVSLQRALALNPSFDFVHAPEARRALAKTLANEPAVAARN